jgi:two-component system sensor histidine kinase KdpD
MPAIFSEKTLSNAPSSQGAPAKLLHYLLAAAGVALTTVVIHAVPGAEDVSNISLLYLLVVIASAYWLGSGPSILAALLAVLSFNWFFVQPRHTLSVSSPADWLALGIFLVTAIVINHLTQDLRLRAEHARQKERETEALARASWAVASQVSHEKALAEVLEKITGVVSSEVAAIIVSGPNNSLQSVASHAERGAMPDWARSEESDAVHEILGQGASVRPGASTCGRPGSPCYLPLAVEQRVLGVLFLRKPLDEPFRAEEWRIVESLANHAAVALERHRLMQAQAQAEALGEADKLKTALLSMVSHDFRSPLAAIKTSVTGLLQDGVPWDACAQRELLLGIDQETDRLNRMVGDILALSRLEADAWRPQLEPTSVTEIIGAALDGFSAPENARIRVAIAPGVPEVPLDSVQIVQVLHNLLENALKYSPEKTPVELQVAQHDGALAIEVLDRGWGLPQGEEERIFERFYRAARWRESSLPGSGIGLAICRGLAEAHGGRLQASSRNGGGAVFRLSLPLAPAHTESQGN